MLIAEWMAGWSSYSELLIEHCLIFPQDGGQVCQLVLACVVQVTLQFLQGDLRPFM